MTDYAEPSTAEERFKRNPWCQWHITEGHTDAFAECDEPYCFTVRADAEEWAEADQQMEAEWRAGRTS